MKTFLVSYDLIGPNRDYEAVADKLRTFGTRSKPLESVWIIKSDKTTTEIRDFVKTALDSNDKLLVVDLVGNGSWFNFPADTTAWLKKNL